MNFFLIKKAINNIKIMDIMGIYILGENNISLISGAVSFSPINLSNPLPKDTTTKTWGSNPINVP